MSRSTEELIAALAAEARPVRRLPPPGRRAALWLALILGFCAVAIALWANLPDFWRRTGGLQTGLAWAASLATGASAVVAAAYLSLPDRSRRWALLPLPFLVLWIGLSGAGCLSLDPRPDGDSHKCFVFILASGIPLAGFLLWRLRRARPMQPRLVAATAALGAAGLSAALLQFFHPFAITWLDLGVHLAAVGLLVGLGGLATRVLDGAR